MTCKLILRPNIRCPYPVHREGYCERHWRAYMAQSRRTVMVPSGSNGVKAAERVVRVGIKDGHKIITTDLNRTYRWDDGAGRWVCQEGP